MHNRFIKNWVTTVIGTAVITVGLIMWYNEKIDTTEFGVSVGIGGVIAGFKYKKDE